MQLDKGIQLEKREGIPDQRETSATYISILQLKDKLEKD